MGGLHIWFVNGEIVVVLTDDGSGASNSGASSGDSGASDGGEVMRLSINAMLIERGARVE